MTKENYPQTDIKPVLLEDLSPEKQAAILKASEGLSATYARKPTKGKKSILTIEGIPQKASPKTTQRTVSKGEEKPKVPKGAITSIEAANAKERIFTVNGIKFYAAVADSGHRILSACNENKKLLESANRVLLIKGYVGTVKRSKEEKTLWILSAKEKKPSGPWPDADQTTKVVEPSKA